MRRRREPPPEPPPEALIEVARYVREDQAEDRGLVVLALGRDYWIFPKDGVFSLMVRLEDAEAVAAELSVFEEERRAERERQRREYEAASAEPPVEAAPKTTLWVYGWTLAVFFLIQVRFAVDSAAWLRRGEADAAAIMRGEAWRVLTALTLHGDFGHLAANIAAGAIFAGALLPLMGPGWTWLGIVLCGAAGNWLNAWAYFSGAHEAHFSIGASTAVFGGLGMLVGWQAVAAVRRHSILGAGGGLLRQVWFPVAAGLALLAYLGAGGGGEHERVDFMAHFFGMLVGGILGVALAWARLPQRTPVWARAAAGAAAFFLPWVAWWIAFGAKAAPVH